MKKISSVFVVVFFSLSTFCQTAATLSETLEWIKSKIELYSSCGTLCYTANVKYDLVAKEITINYKSNWNNQVIYKIPLKDINSSGYSFTKDYIFTIKTNRQSITWINIDSNGNTETKMASEAYRVFDGEKFRANDLESRLINAFNNAARLSGANVVKEVF
jgi:viroplasmin and RNaseH domain-containing protein